MRRATQVAIRWWPVAGGADVAGHCQTRVRVPGVGWTASVTVLSVGGLGAAVPAGFTFLSGLSRSISQGQRANAALDVLVERRRAGAEWQAGAGWLKRSPYRGATPAAGRDSGAGRRVGFSFPRGGAKRARGYRRADATRTWAADRSDRLSLRDGVRRPRTDPRRVHDARCVAFCRSDAHRWFLSPCRRGWGRIGWSARNSLCTRQRIW